MLRSESYDYPQYYEIAFSFRDIPHEVDVMEECIRRHSLASGKRVLELASGPSPHMIELFRRGYHYTGIDINENMLEYVRAKAKTASVYPDLRNASMIDFSLDVKVDFAFVMLGSLYVTNTSEMNRHFISVANALTTGGLYLLDWCVNFDLTKVYSDNGEEWETSLGGITVKTKVKMRPVDFVQQLFEENLIMEVDDNGDRQVISSRYPKKLIFPQEFLFFINQRQDFELMGWWNDWDLSKPLESVCKEIARPIILLRKKGEGLPPRYQ
jgi:SAM-dependent methyltransferase